VEREKSKVVESQATAGLAVGIWLALPVELTMEENISLYASVEKGEISKEDESLINAAKANEQNPEALLIDKENAEYLEGVIEKELSKFEKQVLDLHIVGLGYTEIARILGKDAKATDNALQRVKAKLKKVLYDKI
jgi:RNA polymerase sporulation-specific sigma factor